MQNRTVPCRVCGKAFVPCNKPSNVIGAFNYRSIACSPECGAEYLRRVQAARQATQGSPDAIVSTDAPKVERPLCGNRKKIKPVDDAADLHMK